VQNPKDDNGYKVYWGNACQIIPPHDAGIAAAILENLEPQTWDETLVDTSDLVTDPTEAMTKGYFEELSKLSYHRWVLCPLVV
jgi:phosphoglucomutase